MEKLGFYAKDKNNNLYQFKWDKDDNMFILKGKERWVEVNPEFYQILEIGYFVAK